MMSSLIQKMNPSELAIRSLEDINPLPPWFSCSDFYREILVLADDLLKDECPISQVDEWLYRIDDTSLQLKLWGETVGIEQSDLPVDENIDLVIANILRRIMSSLHKIQICCKDTEADRLPQIKSKYVSEKKGA